MLDLDNAQQSLLALRTKYADAIRSPLDMRKMPQINHLKDEIHLLERDIALAKGEEAALLWEWPLPDAMSTYPLPILIMGGAQCWLIYETPGCSETRSAKNPHRYCWALIEFNKCPYASIGNPNDEVIEGHRLYGRGLEVGGAHIVQNSIKRKELERIAQFHSQYDSSAWRRLRHFVLSFKDTTFECIAEDYACTIIDAPDINSRIKELVFSHLIKQM